MQYAAVDHLSIDHTCYLQSILEYNGGAVIAMKGKDCVAIASDLRYGIRLHTHGTNFPVSGQSAATAVRCTGGSRHFRIVIVDS